MGKQSIENAVEAFQTLRASPGSPETLAQLRKALTHRNNYVVSKAAALVAEFGLRALTPDLIAAFDRFLVNPVKSDPQCWAKAAIVKGLMDLGHDDADVYLRGLSHFQLEPVWGGREDTAATLRGTCALSLVECRLDAGTILRRLIDLLSDPEKVARVDAVRAISHFPEAPLLLRMKAAAGDPFSEVVGQCFASLLEVSPEDVNLVAQYVDPRHGDVAFEAVAALGASRTPAAIAALIASWRRQRDPELRGAILTSLGPTRDSNAHDFLLSLIAEASSEVGAAAVTALARSRFLPELRERVAAAVRARNDARVAQVFDEQFADSP